MTTEERIKATADYFNLDLNENDKKRLADIWDIVPLVVIQKGNKPVPTIQPNNPENTVVTELLLSSATQHGVTVEQLKGSSRKLNLVDARVHFCRKIKIMKPKISSKFVGRLLNRHHTTILHYWYVCKANCIYPPLPKPPKEYE